MQINLNWKQKAQGKGNCKCHTQLIEPNKCLSELNSNF
jgi:hypothetical protein